MFCFSDVSYPVFDRNGFDTGCGSKGVLESVSEIVLVYIPLL